MDLLLELGRVCLDCLGVLKQYNLRQALKQFYGDDIQKSDSYGMDPSYIFSLYIIYKTLTIITALTVSSNRQRPTFSTSQEASKRHKF